MEYVNLLFYKGNSFLSKAICKFTNSIYSHVALKLDEIHIIEINKFNLVSINHIFYRKYNYDIYRIYLTKQQKEKVLEFINIHLQSKYDYKYIFSRLFNKLFGLPIKNNIKRYTCDELIFNAFKYAGIELIDNMNKLSPGELAKSKYLTKIP